eukprot:jgi/Psemu1/32140/gm1.32140_g
MTRASKHNNIYQNTKKIKVCSHDERLTIGKNQRTKRNKQRERSRIYDVSMAIDENFDYVKLASMLNGSSRRRGLRRPPFTKSFSLSKPCDSSSQTSSISLSLTHDEGDKEDKVIEIDSQPRNVDWSELVTMTKSMYIREYHRNKGDHNCRRGAISFQYIPHNP